MRLFKSATVKHFYLQLSYLGHFFDFLKQIRSKKQEKEEEEEAWDD